jgi:aspartyl-tRNA(Asn)/glutamyl-tRNA(Gln) amidotransferase subunit A
LGYAVCDPEVEKLTYDAALALCDAAGIELVDVDVRLPNPGRAWGILSTVSMAANHLDTARGRLDEVTPVPRNGFEMIERLTPDELLRAIRRRQEMLAAIAAAFDEVDLLLTPTTATPAFVAEGPPPFEIAGQRVGGMGSVPFTAPFNVSGQPAVSIPAGCTADGLPVGLQVVTRRHDEPLVLAAGLLAETNRPWPQLAPAYR